MHRINATFQRGPRQLACLGALLLASANLALAEVNHHAQADALLAEAARLAPLAQAVELNIQVVSPAEYATKGNWSSVIPWAPHIPVSAALLPDGRLLTFASNQRTTFPDGPQFTYAAVWDPATGQFTEINNGRHDMFCGGLALLQDGRLLVNGGNGINGTTALTSLFDWRTNEWVPAQTMADGRWYNTSVALPGGEVFTASGNGGGNGNGTIEQWNASSGWRRMSGIAWQNVANPPIANAIETNWHPFFLMAPDGRVLHFGPHPALDWITPTGTGSMTAAGASIPGGHYPKQGVWAMYAPGKVLAAGGLRSITDGTTVNKAFTVDFNGATPVTAAVAPMANARSFANSVILPNGEVMVIGGTSVGEFFSDAGTVFAPEIWNPTKGQWRSVAEISVPRNYHSLAMLLPDGRVWSGGGGLSGDALTDHRDAQLFTPPQLFNADGTPAARPQISAAPDRIGPGTVFTVNATPGVQYFSFIRMSSLTHSVSTDLRHVRFTHTVNAPGQYAVAAPASINVLTPGYWMMFAVDANGVWSVSRVIQVTNTTLPVVTNPGQQSVTQNTAVSLQINASATGGTLNHSASGLPAGLSINSGTGLISGTVTAAPGTYRSTILVTAAGQVTSVSFNWIVVLPNLGSGQIAREWWTGISGTTVASLTGNAAYPANPQGRDLLGAFEAPRDWDDETGQRVRGFVHVPVTGQYRFFISSDDQSSLLLSTNDNPANAVQIASQPDWVAPRAWTWYAQQQSALITLNAGTRYFIEALVKDGVSEDHLAVGWQKPGDSAISVIAGTYLMPYLPVSHPAVAWSFDEASWNGTSGEVKSNTSGLFAINGTASGGATTSSSNPALSGNPGTGASGVFNGSSQSVIMPYSAALNPNDFTVGAWVRHDGAVGAARCILASRDDSTTTRKGYGLWTTAGGQWQFRTGADTSALNGGTVTPGQWTHVAATFRTTSVSGINRTGVRRLFINGLLVAEGSGTYVVNTARPLVVGAADSPGTAFFAGAIDEVVLHHAPLSQPDILALRDLRHATTTLPQNQPPQITHPGAQSTVVGSVVSLPVIVNDPENNPITFSATGLPAGLTISASSGVISGTAGTAGSFTTTVSASDGINPASTATFAWNVSTGLVLQPLSSTPKAAGTSVSYTAAASSGVNPRFKWNFGDGTPETAWSTSAAVSHTFGSPGRYLVTLTGTDDTARIVTSTFYQGVFAPLTARKPNVSSSIVFQDLATGNDRVWCVNPDNNSVSAFDVGTRARYAEIATGTAPRSLAFAPDGRLWVANSDTGTISIINTSTRVVASTITLARGSRPYGIAFDPAGTAAWVALEGTGRVLRLNPANGAQLASIDVGGPVRHLSVSADGARVYATRFITPRVTGENTAAPVLTGSGGQVVVIGTAAQVVERTILLGPSTAADTSTSSRGLPNYLGAAVISPDGLSAWVPSKQDNIQRGTLRDGQPLNHENTVRAIASRIHLTTQAEDAASRIDFDNAGMPSAGAFDPWGIYVFTVLEASRDVVIVDAWSRREFLRFPAGRAPQGVVVAPDGSTLYVQNFMDRTVSEFNISGIIQGGSTPPAAVATLNAITTERLTAQVLQGKKLFYDALDPRLALQAYISCASCHNDGGHDGRVWDFTGFGEGLRNNISLKGHGTHGPAHWSGNFDEIQDFEGQIRNFAGGLGLIAGGAPHPPLGTPNAGRSADLDALAAYVTSLTTTGESPHRTATGALTADAVAGQTLFKAQNCAACHSGSRFTNSTLNLLANIGTLIPSSGKRLGAPLTGLDVPTLRGVWNTAPYLHDGRAGTLADAIRAHQGLTLTTAEVDQLAAFVSQIDDQSTTAPAPVNIVLATASMTVSGPFTVTGALSEVATGFAVDDIIITGGTLNGFTLTGTDFSFGVTPTATNLQIQIPAGKMTDSLGIPNLASNTLNITTSSDVTRPAITLASASTSVFSAFSVSVSASEVIAGLSADDFVVTNGTASNLTGGAASYSVTITPTLSGVVTVQLPAGTVLDAAANPNTASNLLSVTYSPIVVPQVVKIEAEDFDAGGEGIAYHDTEVENFGFSGGGFFYRAGGVDIEPSEDNDGSPSIGWTQPGEWVNYTTALSPGTYTLNLRAGTSPAGPFRVRVLLNGTLAATVNVTSTGGWNQWRTFSIPDVIVSASGQSVMRVEFPDGNVNFNWIEWVSTNATPDTTRPAVQLTTSSASVSAPFNVSATFSEAVTGVALNDFVVTNGSASNLAGSGAAYSVRITPGSNGPVTITMPASAASDAAGNTSTASNLLSVTYAAPSDPVPTVVLSTVSSSASGPFVVTTTFSESVSGLLASEFTVTNGTVTALSAAGAVWSATVTPATTGNVAVTLPANAAQDTAGNGNLASNTVTVFYSPGSGGLTADYYIGKNFEQFSLTRTDPKIDFSWAGSPGGALPADVFSVRWRGFVIPRYTESYSFTTASDDGVRLWVNGRQLVNNWTNHGETFNTGVIALEAGVPVPITMEFYEDRGAAVARLLWQSSRQAREVIPQSQLQVIASGSATGSNPSQFIASADADGDSTSDFLEQALGISTDSGIISAEEGLQIVKRGVSAVDATLRRPSGQNGLSFALEASSDLVNWTVLSVAASVVDLGGGWERMTWANLHAVSGQSLARGIIRLRVTPSGGGSAVTAPLGWQLTPLRPGVQSFGLNLTAPALYTGSISTQNGRELVLSEQAGLSAAVEASRRCYLEIISGPQAGHRLDVRFVSATACVISTDSPATTLDVTQASLAGARVVLRPHRTLGEVFDPALFKASTVAASADQVLFYAPEGYIACWLCADGAGRRWVLKNDASHGNANDMLIPAGTGVMLQISNSAPAPLLSTGAVRTTAFAIPLQAGYNLTANPWPLDATPSALGMTSSAFVSGTSPAATDQIQLWSGDANPATTGYTGSWLLQRAGQTLPTWVSMKDASLLSQNNASLLKAGRTTFIKAQNKAGRPVWIIPPP